ncbi:O-antigen ligase family protein, partial [Proteus vulgaris]|uniref:O-antigen ligase family protein n=1 Tax=Proteus vulgaris TaxID=585 RepID=UPI0013D2E772
LEAGRALRSHDESTAHRAILWTYGAEAFLARPVFGYGSQNAVEEVRRRAARDGFDVPPYRHLHNEFITTAVGRGLVGIAALLMLLAAPIMA